jgi:L-seryl-tRNA(Ser) seleniumtransferase
MGATSPETGRRQALLRALPSIDELLLHEQVAPLGATVARPLLVRACRAAVQHAREQILSGRHIDFDPASVPGFLSALGRPNLRRVINATGVVLHTNLGRAPLSVRAVERIAEIAAGYCNLELDLEEGERGNRSAHVSELLCLLTGAEAALVVNNCAAATLLTLSALAHGKDVIISRGELVEIGGGFRVPDVMLQSGCRLVEVGTTNRTRLADYEMALTPSTGLLLKVHQSNFALVGFTEAATTTQLSLLARAHGVLLFEDLGSGALVPLYGEGLTSEPTVRAVVEAGADVVAFSGDKLLGGPQAGVLVGRRSVIDRLTRHPLTRALRVDKLTVAALEATLEHYRDGLADTALPTRAMLTTPARMLESRAGVLSGALSGAQIQNRIVPTTSRVGGGSMPLAEPHSFAVAVVGEPAAELHEALRAGNPAIVARICDDELWFDVRCLTEADCHEVASRVAAVVRGATC